MRRSIGPYLKEAERLREDGAFIRRVILDHELKRGYQAFLQERNRGKSDSDGRHAHGLIPLVYTSGIYQEEAS